MGTMASQITCLTIVYSTVYSGADQRKHQSSASLAFVRRIHRRPVNSPHKWPVTRKMFPFDDVIMNQSCSYGMAWPPWVTVINVNFGVFILQKNWKWMPWPSAGKSIVSFKTVCRRYCTAKLMKRSYWVHYKNNYQMNSFYCITFFQHDVFNGVKVVKGGGGGHLQHFFKNIVTWYLPWSLKT